MCDITPLAPTLHQLLRTISLLYGRWSISGPDRGIAHFFTTTRNTIEGAGEKKELMNKTNSMLGVNSKCKTRSYVTLCIPVSIYRLTLTWISSENSTTLLECRPILTRLPSLLWTSSHPTGLSAVRCRLSSRVTLPQLPSSSPFVQLSSRVPLPTSSHPRSRVQNPLSGFAPKQTKESSAWRTTYIVLQMTDGTAHYAEKVGDTQHCRSLYSSS